jgi:hypothetical protein
MIRRRALSNRPEWNSSMLKTVDREGGCGRQERKRNLNAGCRTFLALKKAWAEFMHAEKVGPGV